MKLYLLEYMPFDRLDTPLISSDIDSDAFCAGEIATNRLLQVRLARNAAHLVLT